MGCMTTFAVRHALSSDIWNRDVLHRSRHSTLDSRIPVGDPGIAFVSFRDGSKSPFVVGKAAPSAFEVHLGVSRL